MPSPGTLALEIPSIGTRLALAMDPKPSSLAGRLPLKVDLLKWKQEIYFTTPIPPSDYEGAEVVKRVAPGGLYYWPPGQALCIFYGVSQIYTPGRAAGLVLGAIHLLDRLRGGEKGELRELGDADLLESGLVGEIEARGYKTAPVLVEGEEYQAAGKLIPGGRVHVLLYEESSHLMAESEPLFHYDGSLPARFLAARLRRIVEEESRRVRLDLSEAGYVVLSGVLEEGELGDFLEEYEAVWRRIYAEGLL